MPDPADTNCKQCPDPPPPGSGMAHHLSQLPPDVINLVELSRHLFPSIVGKMLTNNNLSPLEAECYTAIQSRNVEELRRIASRYNAGER